MKNDKVTRTTRLKALRTRRTELCNDRRVWQLKEPNVLPIDLCLGCAHAKPKPWCEGCAATLYRADRLAEIAADIKTIDAEISTITGKPYMTAKPKHAITEPATRAEQLPLFV